METLLMASRGTKRRGKTPIEVSKRSLRLAGSEQQRAGLQESLIGSIQRIWSRDILEWHFCFEQIVS